MSLSSILFGRTSHRFEQFEGTLSPSDKADGQYRLDGDVVVVRSLLKKNIAAVILSIALKEESIGIKIPPVPRYLLLTAVQTTVTVPECLWPVSS